MYASLQHYYYYILPLFHNKCGVSFWALSEPISQIFNSDNRLNVCEIRAISVYRFPRYMVSKLVQIGHKKEVCIYCGTEGVIVTASGAIDHRIIM